MKSLCFNFAIALLLLLSTGMFAQTSLDFSPTSAETPSISARVLEDFLNAKNHLVETKITSVNIRAVRDFTKVYKEVEDVRWFTSETGYTASFFTNGINTKVAYDKHGKRFYSLRSYNESDMTFNLRDLVKRNYYDHNIIGVYQFDFSTKTVYVIRMQDKKSNILTLKVFDGKIEEISRH